MRSDGNFGYRKAPVPMFTKDENKPEDENTKVDFSKTEKFKPLKEDPNFIKMKADQKKAEKALKEWKKVALKYFNHTIAKGSREKENHI